MNDPGAGEARADEPDAGRPDAPPALPDARRAVADARRADAPRAVADAPSPPGDERPRPPPLSTGPASGFAPLGPPVAPPAPVVGVPQLLGTSFDLLLRLGTPIRRASFYIGVVVLGTVGPIALAIWGLVVAGYDLGFVAESTWIELGEWLAVLGMVAFGGVIVASIESQAVVVALLGGHMAGRPISVREAIQRSRMVFWTVVAATLVVTIPTSLVQNLIGQETQQGLVAGFLLGIAIQTPFVYATAGIVLGGVGPVEALKRSVRIMRARKVAAIVLALMPTAFGLLTAISLQSGLDLAIRAIDALGLGPESGPVGVAVLTALIIGLVFAAGTLLLTAAGIIYAPQTVMFVGLTRATMGLDHVRPGGSRALEPPAPDHPRFRWLTRPMLLAMALAGVGLAGLLATAGG